jgi:pyruvate dehydrogenase E2 component (dihydrolipoamide acetyltransferase)
MPVELKLPNLGENVEKGDVVRVLVGVGDRVDKDQPVLELETDKATIEVPSTVAGTITAVKVKAGEKVHVGHVVFEVETSGAAAPVPVPAPSRPTPAPVVADAPAVPITVKAPPAPVVDIAAARQTAAPRVDRGAGAVPAAPSTRRYARELGVEIAEVAGTGPGGRIGQADVKDHVKTLIASPGAARLAQAPLPDFSKWGATEAKPMSNIRRKTAEHLSSAWAAPHVTQHDRADVTELEAFRKAYAGRVEKAGGKLTVTAILLKVVSLALDKFPQFATSADMAGGAIIYKHYRHVGVAVDTHRTGSSFRSFATSIRRPSASWRPSLGSSPGGLATRSLASTRCRAACLPSAIWGASAGQLSRRLSTRLKSPSWAYHAGRSSPCGATASSCRARCCRCPCPTTTASSTARMGRASCASLLRRSSSR